MQDSYVDKRVTSGCRPSRVDDRSAWELLSLVASEKWKETQATIDLSKYDTDKSAHYIANYEREFGHLFERPVRLLELGVQRGGSMQMFRDLFPCGQIAGLDLNDVAVEDDSGRIHVYRGFQQDSEVLDRIAEEVAPGGFDIIIDDASHLGRYTADSFWHLFPRHLKPGGVYVLDDWGSGYHETWPDGHRVMRELRTGAVPNTAVNVGWLENGRRRSRASARAVSASLAKHPRLEAGLRRAFLTADGATIQRRFPSHDYGMVGFVKQLVDEASIKEIDSDSPSPRVSLIERIVVCLAQTFVWKAGAVDVTVQAPSI